MGRYVQTGDAVQTPALGAGDIGFTGINNRLDPSQLAPGIGADARNMRFTTGAAASRKGIRKLNWLNRAVVTGDYRRKIDPFGVVYGVGKFRDPNGMEWDIIAGDGQVYACRENQFPPLPLPLPAGVAITSPVTFTQAFNVLILFRGEALPELKLERISEGFTAIAPQPNVVTGSGSENPTDGTEPIPNASRGLFFQNRVFIPYNRDLVAVSDYLNYTRFSPIRSAFRINQGSSDALVTLGRFNETTLIAFKEQSIYAIGNITGDLSGATLYEITSEYGCKAPKSVAAVGKDLWFLADKRGVCSITLTEQNKIQGVDVPVSQDIQKTIDRINWRHAAGATAAYWQNRLYMAVPLDNAEVLKPNLVPVGATYDEDGVYSVPVRLGRHYRWTKGNAARVRVETVVDITDDGNYPVGGPPDFLPVIAVQPGQTYRWFDDGLSATSTLTNGDTTYVAEDSPVVFVAQSDVLSYAVPDGHGNVLLERIVAQTGDFIAAEATALLQGGTPEEEVTASLQPLFSAVNNAVLIYDFQVGKWSGHDESAALMVVDWALTTVDGKQRLAYFGADGTLNLYEEGTYDENIYEENIAPIVLEPVVSLFVSRGYLFDTLEPKSFLRVLVALATLNPTYTIVLLTDGAGESFTLALDRTKNRLKYYRPHDAPDWVPTNIDGDYLLPFRQDYAWVLGATDEIFLDEKINPDLMQEIEEKFWSKGRGKYAQISITNRTGRLELKSLNLEAVLASKRFGVHA